jgi:hypothetical protein
VERQQRIETLFAGALEQPAAERDAWLRRACGSDPDLLREVGSLLAHHRDVEPENWAAAAAAGLIGASSSIKPGTRIGVYEILEPIGAGGMGEVYRARDTRLRREVAIKVLPNAFAQDPDRLARFTREALVLASLNHPNIAAIYGVEERALVMELVEGPTNAYAHFSLRRGMSAALRPAALAVWKRRLSSPTPQVLHAGAAGDSAAADEQRLGSLYAETLLAALLPSQRANVKRSARPIADA